MSLGFKEPRLNVLQAKQEYPASSVSNGKTTISTKVYCNIYETVFNIVVPSCR